MVCIGNMLGFYPGAFWPVVGEDRSSSQISSGVTATRQHQWGRTTEPLEAIRDKVSVLSGLDHGLKGGHFAIHAFLSGVRQIDARSMPEANVTMDQFASQFVVGQTRFPTLTIGSDSGIHGGCQLSWSRNGTRVPPVTGPAELFDRLFVGTADADKQQARERFDRRNSILDAVSEDANAMQRRLNADDRQKLDEYFTSVRDVEHRLEQRRQWLDIPKPGEPFDRPRDRNMVEDLPLLYDLIAIALETDSTRIATLEIGGDFDPRDLGISGGYHGLSHHGQVQANIEKLIAIETYQVQQFVRFIQRLADHHDAAGSLLDQTTVLFGSGMGNANSHTNTRLPVVIAGGGWDHGRMVTYEATGHHRPPLTNLFLSMLHRFGAEVDQFATSTGTLRGLA